MENSATENRKPRSPIFLIVSIVGAILLTVFAIFIFVFVIPPNLIPSDSIKSVANNADGKRTETPLSDQVTQPEPKIVEERAPQAEDQADKQKSDQEIERTQPNPALIDELLSQSSGTNASEQFTALRRLADIAIVEEKRDSTLRTLRATIAGKNGILHDLGWKAYKHWMNVQCAPELRRIVGKSPTHRDAALNALFELKLEEDLPLLIANFSKLSFDAKKSLGSFGPKVEPTVLEKLKAEQDLFARDDLITLLREVGTEKSIALLTELRSSGDLGLKIQCESTIQAINLRLGLEELEFDQN